ncbi:MAG TPA: hypothetical protein VI583_13050 [Cyclobacteriaceae bacterium]|nr:hypothetical protein [Cyclobacteriaceae bacterium]
MKDNIYKTHQKILGALIIAYSAMNIFAALSLIAAMNIIYAFLDEPEIVDFIAILSKMIGIVLLVVSVPALVTGIGILKEKEWSKPFSLIIGIVYLVFFPVGTIIGIYTIWLSTQTVIKEKEPVMATDLVR